MKRILVAVGLASLLGPLTFSANVQAQNVPELPIPVPSVSATWLPQITASPSPTYTPSPSPEPSPTPEPVPIPAPVQTIIKELPGPVQTIIDKVPGPVKTIIQPSPVPGPTRTILVPGPTRTIFIFTSPQPARTIFVTVPASPIGQPPAPSATLSSIPPTPEPTTAPEVVFLPGPETERRIEVSIPQAIGISLGLVALGIALGLLSLYLVYGIGFKDAQRNESKTLSDLKDELFGR